MSGAFFMVYAHRRKGMPGRKTGNWFLRNTLPASLKDGKGCILLQPFFAL
jgi:hypothetical protein